MFARGSRWPHHRSGGAVNMGIGNESVLEAGTPSNDSCFGISEGSCGTFTTGLSCW